MIRQNKCDPILDEWPEEELEYITMCPVCNSESRKVLHKDLVDNVFNCAPGKWTLYECGECKSAYLNPRPKIYKAYENYYTHEHSSRSKNYDQLTIVGKIKRRMANAYKNWCFGSNFQPETQMGIPLMYIFPRQRNVIDRSFRNLPVLPKKQAGRLLDVGFGSGDFLEKASSIGWSVTGVDFDEVVVKLAQEKGFNVYKGSIDVLKDKSIFFDVITLNNVIEHLHDPVEALKICYSLLKPGGVIWLETPNNFSYGHKIYAGNWRGIETPRHLVIFNSHSLSLALKKIGFEEVMEKKRPSPIHDMFIQSEELNNRKYLKSNSLGKIIFQIKVMIFRVFVVFRPSRQEFTTLQAKRPMS